MEFWKEQGAILKVLMLCMYSMITLNLHLIRIKET